MRKLNTKAFILSILSYITMVLFLSLYFVFIFILFFSENLHVRHLELNTPEMSSLENLEVFRFTCLISNILIIFFTGSIYNYLDKSHRKIHLFLGALLLCGINVLFFDFSGKGFYYDVINILLIFPVFLLGNYFAFFDKISLRDNGNWQLSLTKWMGTITCLSIPFLAFYSLSDDTNISRLIILIFSAFLANVLTIFIIFLNIHNPHIFYILLIIWIFLLIPFFILNLTTILLFLAPVSYLLRIKGGYQNNPPSHQSPPRSK